MRNALRPIATQCFRVPEVTVKAKCNICQGLLMSKGLFGCSTWHTPTLTEQQAIHANTMYVYRSATATHYCEVDVAVSDQQLLNLHGLLAPMTFVRLSRLGLAIRVICRCGGDLKRILFAARKSTKSWLRAVEDDFA